MNFNDVPISTLNTSHFTISTCLFPTLTPPISSDKSGPVINLYCTVRAVYRQLLKL